MAFVLGEASNSRTSSVELVRRAQAGEEEALARLLERYSERIRPMVRARLGTRLRQRVDSLDILQETFIEAVRLFDGFEMRDESSLLRWLARIAELRVKEAAQRESAAKRDAGREQPLDDSEVGEVLEGELAADAISPSGEVAREEARERIVRCLERLPDEQREAILLRDYAGASWKSVAEALGRPSPGAARMLHARALARLAALYGP